MPSPKLQYKQKLHSEALLPDSYQEKAVDALDQLYWELQSWQDNQQSSGGWFKRLFQSSQPEQIVGLYLWGGVGRGKTHLCDMFFNSVCTTRKMRLHYHRFMILVQESLLAMDNIVDPVDKVAENWATKYKLLVLDEMHINDITNALLMKRLLRGLFIRGVVLVTTSNTPPSGLYNDGLQRQEFLPAIQLLEKNTQVMCLDGTHDYRMHTLEKLQTYLSPINEGTNTLLNNYFQEIAGDEREQIKTGVAIINERKIPIVKRAASIIWFDFDSLCNTARANEDYIEISNFYNTVIVSNIPQMDSQLEDAARRFVNMIDEFYDNSTNLIVSAKVTPDKLYVGKKLRFEFERALSRLLEMQSKQYFSKTRASN